MVMSALVWYILPGMLGRTYNMKNESIGIDIFNHEDIANARRIDRYLTISEYKVISDSKEASDFLDITGSLALKVKSGAASIEGKGNYLRDSSSFTNKIDVLVKVHYETVLFTLPSSIKPRDRWQDSAKNTESTHYIRSITYGGDLLASLRFTAKNAADKEIIKGVVEGNLEAASGSFGVGLKGNLEKISSSLKDSASMEINYYASVPINSIPSTIDGLMKLVDEFPEQTKAVNDGLGIPLRMEVFSLAALDSGFPAYYNTMAFQDQLDLLNGQFDDIRSTKRGLSDWLKTIPPVLSSDVERKIGDFSTNIENLNTIFNEVIANLNLGSGSSSDQFNKAIDAYIADGEDLPNKYIRALGRLKAEVLESSPALKVELGGDMYDHWGATSCSASASPETFYEGVLAATNLMGPSQFVCLPLDRRYLPQIEDQEDYDFEDIPGLQPVAYKSTISPKSKPQSIVCAKCRIPGRSTVMTLPGKTSCPTEWVEQYKGFLVSSEMTSLRGDFICVDSSRSRGEEIEDPEVTQVTEVTVKCGNLPCDIFKPKVAIPCVVCSFTKSHVVEASVRF